MAPRASQGVCTHPTAALRLLLRGAPGRTNRLGPRQQRRGDAPAGARAARPGRAAARRCGCGGATGWGTGRSAWQWGACCVRLPATWVRPQPALRGSARNAQTGFVGLLVLNIRPTVCRGGGRRARKRAAIAGAAALGACSAKLHTAARGAYRQPAPSCGECGVHRMLRAPSEPLFGGRGAWHAQPVVPSTTGRGQRGPPGDPGQWEGAAAHTQKARGRPDVSGAEPVMCNSRCRVGDAGRGCRRVGGRVGEASPGRTAPGCQSLWRLGSQPRCVELALPRQKLGRRPQARRAGTPVAAGAINPDMARPGAELGRARVCVW